MTAVCLELTSRLSLSMLAQSLSPFYQPALKHTNMMLDDRRSLTPDLYCNFFSSFLRGHGVPRSWTLPFLPGTALPRGLNTLLSLQLPNGQKGTHVPSGTLISLGMFPLLSTSNLLDALCLPL